MGHCLEPEITAGSEVHLLSGSSVPTFPALYLLEGRQLQTNQTVLFLPGCLTLIVPFWPEASTKKLRMFLSPQKPCSESCSSFSAAQLSFLLAWLILQVNKSHLPSKRILLRGPPHPGALSPESHPSASLDDCIDTWLLLFRLQENSTAWSLPSARTLWSHPFPSTYRCFHINGRCLS